MSEVRRRPGWEDALAMLMADRNGRPFVWGSHDCCLFVADCVEAMTGFDPAASLRGRYQSHRGAERLIRQAGGLGELVAPLLRAPEVAPAFARLGDVGLVLQPDGTPTMAVHGGAGWHAPAAGEGGLAWLPGHLCQRAWRVGG